MMAQDLTFHTGHRERLRQKFLDDKITDYEVLELLLTFVIPRRDVRPLSRYLIQKYSGLHQICSAPFEDLMAEPGLGRNTAVFFKLLQRVILCEYKEHLDKRPIFHNETVLTNYCLVMLNGKTVEEFHVLYLDANKRLIDSVCHSVGTNDESAIYPREILRHALNINACNVVMLHNHPTAGMGFSSQDIKVSTELEIMLNAAGIALYDHYLVSGGQLLSARSKMFLGRMPPVTLGQ